jgi:hypothetical protein
MKGLKEIQEDEREEKTGVALVEAFQAEVATAISGAFPLPFPSSVTSV